MDSTLLNTCPIKYWKKQRPNALAIGSYTYTEFDAIIEDTSKTLPQDPIIIFMPQKTVADVATFFAAWRREKGVYPLNFRIPTAAREERQEKIKNEMPLATFIETSSASKIVSHTLESHLISAKAAIKALDIQMEDRYCLNLPLFHVAGIATLLRTFVAGAHLIFEEELDRATHVSMVPTQLFRFVQEGKKIPNLKCLLLGGAPISPTLKEKAKDLPLVASYGMTETGSMVLMQKKDEPIEVLPHTECSRGKDGELFLRGKTLFDHYVGQEKRDPNQWFATKDIANEKLEIMGRKDRQFISGGENIQPEEIEQALSKIEGIIEAKIQPIEDPEWGMRPIAKVLSIKEFTESDLKDALKEVLPSFKIPMKIDVVSAFQGWESKSMTLSQ